MGECSILKELNHPNVLRFCDCFVDHTSTLCLVTEFVEGGTIGPAP
jgi:serine/threonine protein kinase